MVRQVTSTIAEREVFVEELKRLKYEGGLSAKAIAEKLNKEHRDPPGRHGVGFTRASILGYFHRYQIKEQPDTKSPRGQLSHADYKAKRLRLPDDMKTLAPRPPPRKLEPIRCEPVAGVPAGARPWESRRGGECAWPYEVGAAFYSCCAPVWHREDGSEMSYCRGHAKEMFQPRTARPTTPTVEHDRISRARGRRGY